MKVIEWVLSFFNQKKQAKESPPEIIDSENYYREQAIIEEKEIIEPPLKTERYKEVLKDKELFSSLSEGLSEEEIRALRFTIDSLNKATNKNNLSPSEYKAILSYGLSTMYYAVKNNRGQTMFYIHRDTLENEVR